MFGRKPRLPIDSLFDIPVENVSNQTTKEYIEGLKKRMKSARDIANKVTEQARLRMKEGYDRKAKAAKICVGDKVLVKIFRFEGKHKIEDKYEDTIYTVIGQPNENIPVYDVKSENGIEKRLHRNHLFLLSFMDHETTDERIDDAVAKDADSDTSQKKGDKDLQTDDRTTAVALDTEVKEPSEEKTVEDTTGKAVDMKFDEDDEEEDSVLEYISKTDSTGDAWKAVSIPTHVDKGPVLEVADGRKDLGTKPKEKQTEKEKTVKMPEDDDGAEDTDKTVTAIDGMERDVDEDETVEPQSDDTVETEEAEVEGAAGGLRRSKRVRKPPKKFEAYQMHLITNRPLDRRLETLQMLLESGVLNDIDSDMTHTILDAVIK